jgi:enoyl-CoA hydratase
MREIVISSPARNAVSTALLEALARDLAAAGGEPVLLSGAGTAFSAGLDLREVAQLDLPGAKRLLAALEGVVEALYTYPAPAVALVNGHAIAGGCVLALCCDYRVMTADPSARIGLNEVGLGLVFPPRTLAMVRAQLGAATERVVLGAQLYDPAAAREAGLVNEVAADARAVATARLELLARHPRAAYAQAKGALRGRALAVDAAAQRAFEEDVLPRWASEETRAAAARFLKR